jgi:hypothetical protein
MHITFEDEDAKQKAIYTQWLFSLNTVPDQGSSRKAL